jgi:hypothetical protein
MSANCNHGPPNTQDLAGRDSRVIGGPRAVAAAPAPAAARVSLAGGVTFSSHPGGGGGGGAFHDGREDDVSGSGSEGGMGGGGDDEGGAAEEAAALLSASARGPRATRDWAKSRPVSRGLIDRVLAGACVAQRYMTATVAAAPRLGSCGALFNTGVCRQG